MEASDIASIVGAITGLIGAVTGVLALAESRKATSRSNQVALGQAENELRRDITAAKEKYEIISEEIELIVGSKKPDELTAKDKTALKPKRRRQASAIEDVLNAFDAACSQYRDNKIDKIRFRKTYDAAIRKLFERGGPYDSFLNPKDTSHFKSLWRVYLEWTDIEDAKS